MQNYNNDRLAEEQENRKKSYSATGSNVIMPKIGTKTRDLEEYPGGKTFNLANGVWSQFFLSNEQAFKVPITTTQINFGLSFLNLVVGAAITCSLAGAPIGIPMVVNSIISLGEIAAPIIAGSMMLVGTNTVPAATKLAAETGLLHHTTQANIDANKFTTTEYAPPDKIALTSSTIKIAIGLGMIGVGIAACSTGIGAIGGIPLLIAGMMMVSGIALTIPSAFAARASFFKAIDRKKTVENLKIQFKNNLSLIDPDENPNDITMRLSHESWRSSIDSDRSSEPGLINTTNGITVDFEENDNYHNSDRRDSDSDSDSSFDLRPSFGK